MKRLIICVAFSPLDYHHHQRNRATFTLFKIRIKLFTLKVYNFISGFHFKDSLNEERF